MPSVHTFGCLILVSMEARRAHGAAYRQQQLLYSQVSDGAEYFFIPRGKQPIPHMEEWQDNGLSTGSLVQLDNKARNVEFTKSKNIAVYDYIPYNEKVTTHTDEAVTAATILRVKDGQTSEYTATVPTVGECFSNIESVSSSSDEGGSVEAVASELSKVCGDGFWTLRPFDKDDMSKLNGKYSGKQSETALTLKLDKGKIKDGELVVGSLTEKAPLVTYSPLCEGVISTVRTMPRGEPSLLVLTRDRASTHRNPLLRRSRRKAPLATLCGPLDTAKKVSWSDIPKWDRMRSGEFVL